MDKLITKIKNKYKDKIVVPNRPLNAFNSSGGAYEIYKINEKTMLKIKTVQINRKDKNLVSIYFEYKNMNMHFNFYNNNMNFRDDGTSYYMDIVEN